MEDRTHIDPRRLPDLPAWTEPGAPLLPLSLRLRWRDERLPRWLTKEIGLPESATIQNLGIEIWSSMDWCSPRLRNYAIQLVHSRRHEIAEVVALNGVWIGEIEPQMLPWKVRTRHGLESQDYLKSTTTLSNLTFGELFRIKNMGARSVLDFACTAEAAFEPYSIASTRRPFVEDDTVSVNLLDPRREQEAKRAAALDSLREILDQTWITQVSEQDPRFAVLLPPGSGTIYERIDALNSAPPTVLFGDEVALAHSVDVVRVEMQRIESLSLDGALREFLKVVGRVRGKKLDVLCARLGWSGNAPITLEQSGRLLRLTRERVRQIQARFVRRLPKHPVFMPALDRALEVMRRHAPILPEAASILLQREKISADPFHAQGLLEAARICGRTPTFEIVKLNDKEVIATSPLQKNANSIIHIAYKQAGASGVSNVSEVVEECRWIGEKIDEAHAAAVLKHLSEAEFLQDDWFWRPSAPQDRNRLINLTRKMLSVASPIHVSVLREGVRRQYRARATRGVGTWRLTVPPRQVLEQFYRACSAFVVDDQGLVSPRQALDPKRELGNTEQVMVSALRTSPTCLLDRQSFAKSCLARGMNENTFGMFSSYSPIIEHLGTDLWTLRGVRVDPSAVEALRAASAARPREKRILDHGWSAKGTLWIGVRLAYPSIRFVLSVPSAVRRFVANREFAARSEDGLGCGFFRVTEDGLCSGFWPFLRRSGADEDDIFVVDFDLSSGTAIFRLGNDELLDEYGTD